MSHPQFSTAAEREEYEREQMRGWRPIETAPRDGTFVLCCDLIVPVRGHPPIMFVGRWSSEHKGWCDKPWHQDRFTPTHWQPLPAPPPGGTP